MARYQLLEIVYEDIFSFLYEARDTESGHPVFIWMYKPRFGTAPVLTQLTQMATRLQMLRHPHILSLIDHYIEGHTFFAVYTYEDLTPLDTYIESHAPELARIWQLIGQISAAMKAVEAEGLVWGGLNFNHVMVDAQGQVRLVKVGLPVVLYLAFAHRLPVVDDAEFLPPEFIRSGVYTIQSDIYAFGVFVFVSMSRQWPYFRWNTWRALKWRTRLPFRTFSGAGITARMRWLVAWCLCEDPHRRFVSFLDMLRQYEFADPTLLPYKGSGASLFTYIQMAWASFYQWGRKWGWILLIVAVAAGVLGGIKWGMDRSSVQTQTVVPNVVGLSASEALERLAALHLRGEIVASRNDISLPEGTVIECKPPVGREVRTDRAVRLIISKGRGEFIVPNVIGKSLEEVTAKFGKIVSINVVETLLSYEVVKGRIVGQIPSPNEVLPNEHSFDVVVSSGFPVTLSVDSIANHTATITIYVATLPVGGDQIIKIVSQIPKKGEVVMKDVQVPADAHEVYHFQVPLGSTIWVSYNGKVALKERIDP